MSLSPKFFIVLAAITGMISSFIAPIMSYFLVEGLSLPAYYIGVYTITVTIMTVVTSQLLGLLADRGANSKYLYLLATFSLVWVGFIYSQAESFTAVMFAALVFMPFGGAAISQLLTLSRFYAEDKVNDIPSFNAKVRAGISVAWVVGPPSAFFLVSQFGFGGSFITASIVAVIAFTSVAMFIPNNLKANKAQAKNDQNTEGHFIFLAIAIFLGMTSNLTYSSALPLYLMKELNLNETLPGLLMGMVAALEIPVMLLATKFAARFGIFKVFTAAFVFAAVFYVALFFATETWQFFALQPINAVFYGLYAGLGLTLLQQAVPNRTGFTSALYSNLMKVGLMTGTTVTGLVGFYGSFKLANIAAAAFALIAILCLFTHKKINRPANPQ